MKKNSVLIVILLAIVAQISCKKDKDCFGAIDIQNITSRNPLAKLGLNTWEKDINSSIETFKNNIATRNKLEDNIKAVRVDDIRVTLIGDYNFSDFSSGELIIDGTKIAVLPPNAKGKEAVFTILVPEIKSIVFAKPQTAGTTLIHTIQFNGTTTKVFTTASHLYINMLCCAELK